MELAVGRGGSDGVGDEDAALVAGFRAHKLRGLEAPLQRAGNHKIEADLQIVEHMGKVDAVALAILVEWAFHIDGWIGAARSRTGVSWEKQALVIRGDQPWKNKVVCDPTVVATAEGVRVWFGGGDVPRPDERIHGRIGVGMLRPVYSSR